MAERELAPVDRDAMFSFQQCRLRSVCAYETRLAPRYERIDRGHRAHSPAQLIDQFGLYERIEIHVFRFVQAVTNEYVF